jgi:hypothetical protein
MAKASKRPRAREPRKTLLPLSIDLLPMEVLEAIKRLRSDHNLSWEEIERLSSLPYGEKWEARIGSAGFVNWDAMPRPVLEKFPDLHLPHSNLHRWYSLRVLQVRREVSERMQLARDFAKVFADAGIEKADEAVTNAVRDAVFVMLQESNDKKGRVVAAKALLVLRDVMNGVKANAIKERKVKVDEGRLELLERKLDMLQKKSSALAGQMEAAADKGKTPDLKALAAKVRQIYGA